MKVLVTGHRGYIGQVCVGVLRTGRHHVVGLDGDLYTGCDFGCVRETVANLEVDVRDIEAADLSSFDAVIHFAFLPEQSSSVVEPNVVRDMNEGATIRLAECCKKAGVERFLFASSCGVYGRQPPAGTQGLAEEDAVDPTTPYAVSKVRCEEALARLNDGRFTTVCLRHAEVYGVSPRLRLDLIVNDFVASATLRGRVLLPGDGSAWCPLVHVEDLSRVYDTVLRAPTERIRGEVFNIVGPQDNHREIDIADRVTEWVPYSTRRAASYRFGEFRHRIDGSKFLQRFPEFSFGWTLPQGIRQLHHAMLETGLTPGEWRSDRYRRAMRLESMIERGRLSMNLRRRQPAAV